jgi:hypothetical protein
MTRSTGVLGGTGEPAAGFWLMTEPAATVLSHCWVTVPTTKFAPVMAVAAAA